MRRSTRSVKSKPILHEPEDDDELSGQESLDSFDEQDTSEDEWRPESGIKNKGKRRRGEVAESEESEDEDPLIVEEEVYEEDLDVLPKNTSIPPKVKKKVKFSNDKRSASKTVSKPPSRNSQVVADQDILAAQAAIEVEEAEEQEFARQEAAELWKRVRSRKEAKKSTEGGKASGDSRNTSAAAPPPPSLTSWLGIPEPAWPTTCEDAMINDRDSLFIGYVYALTTPSLSTISQLLSHLGKTVHPKTVPTERLPPGMQHLASNRRGANHDMHAWRCLALKMGRTGLNGPEDFGLEEGLEDDGERFGAKEIAKVIKQLGATDVLVIVSRWYGGTMLGPVRFQHIENCARAALSQYMIDEALLPMKKQLQGLDEQLATLRSKLSGSSIATVKALYDDLDPEKAERLILARERAIEMMQKRIDASAITSSQPTPIPSNVTPDEALIAEAEKDISQATTDTVKEKEVAPSASVVVGERNSDQPTVIKEEEEVGDIDLTGWDALE